MSHNALIALGLYAGLIISLIVPHLLRVDPVVALAKTLPRSMSRLFPPSARWNARRQTFFLMILVIILLCLGEASVLVSNHWDSRKLGQAFAARFPVSRPRNSIALILEKGETEQHDAADSVIWDPVEYLKSLAYFEEFAPAEVHWFARHLPRLALPEIKLRTTRGSLNGVPVEFYSDPSIASSFSSGDSATVLLSREPSAQLYQTGQQIIFATTPETLLHFENILKERNARWLHWLAQVTAKTLPLVLFPFALLLLNLIYLKKSQEICAQMEYFRQKLARGIHWQNLPQAKLKPAPFWVAWFCGPHTYPCKVKVNAPKTLGRATMQAGLVYYRGSEKSPQGRLMQDKSQSPAIQLFIPDQWITELDSAHLRNRSAS